MRILMAVLLVGAVAAAPQRRPQSDPQQEYHETAQVQQNYQDIKSRGNYETTTFIPIIRFDKEQGADGSYKTAWETGNNIVADEEGFLKSLGPDPDNEGKDLHAQVQHGSYSYTAPDGQVITVTYTADEHGFRPEGLHLPTPPPVSPEVQKGLDLIYAGIKAQQEAAEREARENPNKKEQNYRQ